MDIVIAGAHGKIARRLARLLVARGDRVRGLIRNPDHADDLRGDGSEPVLLDLEAAEPDQVAEAVAGADAVISALGPSLKRSVKGTAITDGTRTIVEAMQAEGVTRFIGLATPSLADPHDRPHWKPKVLPVMAKLAFPNALAELKGMTEAVTSSPLDYTIARITNPVDKPATGRIKSGFLGHDKVGSAMTRADIAAFLVSQLMDTRYSRAMPAISN